MAYAPYPKQIAAHRAFLVDGYKRGVVYWGRRTGKSLWSIQHLMLSAMIRQGPYHIVFKEYQQAEAVAWNQYLHTIPQELIKETNKSTLTITFNHFNGPIKLPTADGKTVVLEAKADESKPPSSIRLLGSDRADQHRGLESYGIIFDEYQDQDTYGWEFVYEPYLLTTKGWACFMGTAKDRDPWNEMLERAERSKYWYFSKATWRDNPEITLETITQSRQEAEEEGRLDAWLQEHELIPFSQQGAVYPMYDDKVHLIKPEDVPHEGTEYIALDFGFAEGHPMAACFVRITPEDIWYQWDEIHATGVTMDELVNQIRIKMGDRLITGIVADSARPDLIEVLASKGFPVIPAPKKQNSIVVGIQLFAQRLKPKIQLVGEPKAGFYLSNNCKKTRYDFKHYRYREVKEDRHPMELPEKKFDDSLDALRYLELFFKFGVKKDEKPPESSILKSLNSYGL